MDRDRPEASIVVVTRDRAARLESLLQSLAAQAAGLETFEVIVVDDASSDETHAVLDREIACGRMNLAALRNERPIGPGGSRNLGWQRAKAPTIAFIDDDCVASPGWLAAGLAACSGRPGSFVQGRTEPIPAEMELQGPFSYTIEVYGPGPYYETCNIFYPRQLLEQLGGFDSAAFPGPRGEDCDLAWRAIEAGAEPAFAADARVFHAVHRLGPVGKLRRAASWTEAMLMFARHPGLRSAALHNGVFWEVRHQGLLRLLIAALLPRRLAALRIWLAAPYFRHALDRVRAEQTRVLVLPYYLVHDAIEMGAVVRGAIRYRTLVI